MENEYCTIGAARMAGCTSAQAVVEGDIPIPSGRSAQAILLSMGEVTVTGSEVRDGLVVMEGRVRVQLVCSDAQGQYGFSSGAAFRHTITAQEARSNMGARVFASLQSLEVRLSGPDNGISLTAVVDISLRLTDASGVKALSGIFGAPDLELLKRPLSCVSASYEEHAVHTRDEADAGEIVEVLCCDAQAGLNDRAGYGTLYVSALVRDASGSLRGESYEFTFEHDLQDAVSVRVDSIYARCMSEDFKTLVFEAQLTVTAVCASMLEHSVPTAAYSPCLPFEPVTERVCFLSYAGRLEECCTITESVALAPGLPAIHHAAYASCRAGVTSSGVSGGKLYIEGLLFTNMIYHTDTGAYFSTVEDVPFSLALPAPEADTADLDVRCIACVKGSTADRIRVEYTLFVCAELWSMPACSVVTGIEASEPAPVPHGIIVYFALEGETLFEVGKRFRMPTARIREANPEAGDTLASGERLMLIV